MWWHGVACFEADPCGSVGSWLHGSVAEPTAPCHLKIRVHDERTSLAAAWRTAAADPAIAAELEAVFQIIADQVEARRPVCESSGRCCHFREYGHRLYVTGLEAAYALARAGRALAPGEVEAARARGDCPFLNAKQCTIHTVKPSGCRIYYCDPSAADWMPDLSERSLAMIRAIHDRHGVPYRYGEWNELLGRLVEERGPGKATSGI